MGETITDELEFYIKFARPLILNLPESKDRVLAAAWVQKIKDPNSGPDKLRTDYLKLLLFALQRRKLVGVFADDPTNYETLEEFPPEFDLNEIAKRLIEREFEERQERISQQIRGEIGDSPPYTTDCSADCREYVAAQDIPGFGVHCYYAISKEPVNKWQKADKGIYPKLAKSAVDNTSPIPPGAEGGACACPPAEGQTESECLKRKEEAKKSEKKRSRKKWGATPPVAPLGTVPVPEDRDPPTWGSNLVEVRAALIGREGEGDQEEGDFGPLDVLSEVSMFLEEFQKEAISKGSPIKPIRSPKKKKDKEAEEAARAATDEAALIEGLDDIDQQLSQLEEEIKEDSMLMDYLKDQMDKSLSERRRVAEGAMSSRGAPAHAGIPVTTPRPSPSPRRTSSVDRLVKDHPKMKRLK